ncbi:uncharacterized alpha-1,2-galactosyltransferase C1289.13c isoform X1 [Amborella trichopoda]|uniref:Galactosyl transferase GMA12/MNN10 family protein n=1 Tax=Amborella trichopoda TaxID=13333 RepID=W1NHH7_AMBTC|nr:uncharacterized alpha-1,2-galactosyltransferase C1289.13c isoform X1 [Amborella trichopoda]ERM94936.1 hypothetical protein AMTR_s00009p00193920 [Amborella trichopoda]|eukprot:XP_020524667.1 uncharacterized alpha-1,2-galactosyltransferase C1289.13c isoform X1 [Amborella trichopoda]
MPKTQGPPGNRSSKPNSGFWFSSHRLWFVVFSSTLLLFSLLFGFKVIFHRANVLGRQCLRPIAGGFFPTSRIAMVSSSDESKRNGFRSFEGLMAMVLPNKESYAEKFGYDFSDCSEMIDRSRPPSWSKILAVKAHLHNYDWIFWNDADSLITNSNVSLEQVLYSVIGDSEVQEWPDLILTKDATGVNAGIFFVRNSNWSQEFLDTWWNQKEFIRKFGSTKSGDNDALKHLISHLSPQELQKHVRVSKMQCLFNSYPWFPSWKTAFRLITSPKTTWQGSYSEGDFMVHLAGLDDKKRWARKVLREIQMSSKG